MRVLLLVLTFCCVSCGYDHSAPEQGERLTDGGFFTASDGGADGGTTGPGCGTCDAFTADSCGASGQCVCGGSPACGAGQQCVSGSCRCTADSCSSGCCSGLQCLSGTDRFACGAGGAACAPCGGLRRCVSGVCQ